MFKLYNNAPGANVAQDTLSPGLALDGVTPTPDGCSNYLPTTLHRAVCPCNFAPWPATKRMSGSTRDGLIINFGSNDRMFVRYQQDHGFQATYTDPISPLFNLGSTQPEYQGQLMETHTFGPSS